MKRLVAACALVAMVRTPTLAEPDDEVDDTAPISATARLDGHVVRFTAKYRLRVDGPQHGRSNAILALPPGGVAVKATATADGPGEVAHALDLVPAATALARYDATAARPAGPARRWSVLVEGSSHVSVSIAAPRKAAIALELEIQAPACLFRDARHVQVPEAWLRVLPSTVARPRDAAPIAEACGSGAAHWISFADRTLASRPAGPDRVGATAETATLEDGSQVARFELAVAGTLGEIPRDLATAIVLDASRSMTPKVLEVQRDLVEAYLRAAPETQVQVIAYARRARALLPGWQVARHAQVRVDRELRSLALRNGSNYDAGLAEAVAWLAHVRGTRRILLVTDEWRGPRLTTLPNAELQRIVGKDTLVQVVAVDEFSGQPTREDGAALVELAHATGGMSVRTGPLGKDERRDATSLLRPIALDNVELKAPGWKLVGGTEACGMTLDEGRACTWWLQSERPFAIAATGMVWGKRVERVLKPDATRGIDVARALAATSVLRGQDLAERVELASRAAGSAWSLLVEWGGQDGYADGIGAISSGCSCGGSSFSTRHHHSGVGRAGIATPLPKLEVREQLAGPVERCLAQGDDVSVSIATTLQEIADVTVQVHSSATPARETALRACVEDAVWDTSITVPPILRATSATFAFARY